MKLIDEDDEENKVADDSVQLPTMTVRVQLFKKEQADNIFILDIQKDNADVFTFNQFYADIYRAHYGLDITASV
jgi:hypothetical protein